MKAAREGSIRSNGVKTQALLSHFVLQCFNILLCLCRSSFTKRRHEIRLGLRRLVQEGQRRSIFLAERKSSDERNFLRAPGAVTLIPLSSLKYANAGILNRGFELSCGIHLSLFRRNNYFCSFFVFFTFVC